MNVAVDGKSENPEAAVACRPLSLPTVPLGKSTLTQASRTTRETGSFDANRHLPPRL